MEEPLIVNNEKEQKKTEKIEKAVKSWGSKDQDPYYRSNFISKFFFHWAFRLIKLGILFL